MTNEREIKFRAWDLLTESWATDSFDSDVWEETRNHYIVNTVYDEGKFGSRYIFQMFTGLLDKNEREIYEGDILLYEKARMIVTWGSAGGFVIDSELHHTPLFPYNGYSEIIGNIMEED